MHASLDRALVPHSFPIFRLTLRLFLTPTAEIKAPVPEFASPAPASSSEGRPSVVVPFPLVISKYLRQKMQGHEFGGSRAHLLGRVSDTTAKRLETCVSSATTIFSFSFLLTVLQKNARSADEKSSVGSVGIK